MKLKKGINKKTLLAAGYRQVPSHPFSKTKATVEMIRTFYKHQEFPRYHALKVGKQYDLHIDFHRYHNRKINSTNGGELLLREYKRILKICDAEKEQE